MKKSKSITIIILLSSLLFIHFKSISQIFESNKFDVEARVKMLSEIRKTHKITENLSPNEAKELITKTMRKYIPENSSYFEAKAFLLDAGFIISSNPWGNVAILKNVDSSIWLPPSLYVQFFINDLKNIKIIDRIEAHFNVEFP